MINKKSRFLTFIFSMLPGAGHMYIGFMKTGLSLMAIFFFDIFLSSWLDIGPLLFVLPLIWFYSFFDCLNKVNLSEEQLMLVEDKYLFSFDKLLTLDKNVIKKRSLVAGILVLILGIYLIVNNVMSIVAPYISNELYNTIYNLISKIPQMIIGIAIVAVGIKLILGKKKECENND